MSIEVKNLKQVKAKIAKIAKFDKLDMKTAATVGYKGVMDNFKSEAGPSGGWASIKRSGKKLQDSGRLKQSIKTSYSQREATISTNIEYAATHNYGDPKRNIKKRQFMWLSTKVRKRISKVLVDGIFRGLK